MGMAATSPLTGTYVLAALSDQPIRDAHLTRTQVLVRMRNGGIETLRSSSRRGAGRA
jgi:hypothetical protein